jgi:hypothetical protein
MEKMVRVKVGSIVYEIPESIIANYPHLLTALQQQGSKEKLQTKTQTPFSDTRTKETLGSVEASGQISPRRTQRKGVWKTVPEKTQQ